MTSPIATVSAAWLGGKETRGMDQNMSNLLTTHILVDGFAENVVNLAGAP